MRTKWEGGRFWINKSSFSITEAAEIRSSIGRIHSRIDKTLKSREEIAKLCNDKQQAEDNQPSETV